MSAKPATLPRWADVGGSIVVPGAGKLNVGWVTAERPPAQYLNWWQNLVYTWVVFVNAFFTNGGAVVGAVDLGNAAEATTTPMIATRDYLQKIRSTVDHNGYRMGQVTEADETWIAGNTAATLDLPMDAVGSASIASNPAWTFTSTTHVTYSGLSGLLPDNNSTITGLVVYYSPGNTTDSVTWRVSKAAANAVTTPLVVTKTGVSGSQAFDVFAGVPTTGYPRISFSGQFLDLQMAINAVTSSIVVTRIAMTYIADPPGWSYVGATTDQVDGTTTAARTADNRAYLDPDANVNQRTLQLLGQSTASPALAGSSVMTPTKYETFHDANCAYVMEFMLRTGTITDAANKRILAAGIQNNNAGAGNRFVYIYNQDTTANWQLRVVGSATTDTDLGVAVAANTTYRVRLEVYGSSVNSGGSTFIRVFINGVLRFSGTNATLPASDMIRPYFKVGTSVTTAAGPYDMRIGRVRRVWNHLLTADNV